MSTVLVTGASGYIGQALATALAPRHRVIALSRRGLTLPDVTCVRGDFAAFEDLRALDAYEIDAVVHLGAVTGGCFERDGLLVNVEGTRCLLRYLTDRGCRKVVCASSIAAVGMQSKLFRPLTLPVPDEHPCLDRDGYGLSKYLMEEVTRYVQRQHPDLDVINLRLSVVPHGGVSAPAGLRPLGQWALGSVTIMTLADGLRAFTLAVESSARPGVRILNAAGPRLWASVPTAELLAHWYGDEVDASWYRQSGHEHDGVYDVRAIERELGFVAQDLP
jgi:UDP-glucose 4-epimerase